MGCSSVVRVPVVRKFSPQVSTSSCLIVCRKICISHLLRTATIKALRQCPTQAFRGEGGRMGPDWTLKCLDLPQLPKRAPR